MKYLCVALLLCCSTAFSGCGGASIAPHTSSITPTSTWAGTYTGSLDFSGCQTSVPCGGDSISLTIAEAANTAVPGEFSSTITVTGADSTSGKTFTGSGTVLYDGAAPVGPGSEDTNATISISLGDSMFLAGSGSVNTKSPVLIQTIAVNNSNNVNGASVKGPLFMGNLTRQ